MPSRLLQRCIHVIICFHFHYGILYLFLLLLQVPSYSIMFPSVHGWWRNGILCRVRKSVLLAYKHWKIAGAIPLCFIIITSDILYTSHVRVVFTHTRAIFCIRKPSKNFFMHCQILNEAPTSICHCSCWFLSNRRVASLHFITFRNANQWVLPVNAAANAECIGRGAFLFASYPKT